MLYAHYVNDKTEMLTYKISLFNSATYLLRKIKNVNKANCGWKIRTSDLLLMRQASFHCSNPHYLIDDLFASTTRYRKGKSEVILPTSFLFPLTVSILYHKNMILSIVLFYLYQLNSKLHIFTGVPLRITLRRM